MSITLAEFDINKVKFLDPTSDAMGNTDIPIRYERNGKDGYLTLTLPLMRTDNMGISSQNNTSGGASHSMKILFPRRRPIFVTNQDGTGFYEEPETIQDPHDPDSVIPNTYDEAQAYADIFDQVYEKVVDHCFANKNKLGFAQSRQRIMVQAQIKKPLYRRDNENGEEDLNYCPSVYFKFIESGPRGNPPNTVYTRFTGLDGKALDWKVLQNSLVYIEPTVRIERVFLGSGARNIQCKITSGIVHSVIPRGEMNRDVAKVKELVENNPALLRSFLKSMSNLEAYREVEKETTKSEEMNEEPQQGVTLEESVNNPSPPEEEVIAKSPMKSSIPDNSSPIENFMKQQTTRVIRRSNKA